MVNKPENHKQSSFLMQLKTVREYTAHDSFDEMQSQKHYSKILINSTNYTKPGKMFEQGNSFLNRK